MRLTIVILRDMSGFILLCINYFEWTRYIFGASGVLVTLPYNPRRHSFSLPNRQSTLHQLVLFTNHRFPLLYYLCYACRNDYTVFISCDYSTIAGLNYSSL